MYCIDCKAGQLVNHHFIDAAPTSSPQAPPLVVDSSQLLLPHFMFALLLFSVGPISQFLLGLRLVDKSSNFVRKSKQMFLKFSSRYKLKLLEESGVVQIKSKVVDTTIALPVGFIIKPIECDFADSEATVEVIVPHITSNEEVKYLKIYWQLDELEIFGVSSLESIILKPLAFILEQYLGARQDLVWLNQRRTKISNTISKAVLANLELDSTSACKQELAQIESMISKLDRAQIELDNYIKESLANYALAKLNNESTCDKLILIDERLEEFKTKRQETKDFVDAYLSLKLSKN